MILDCGVAVHFGTLNVRDVLGEIPGKGIVTFVTFVLICLLRHNDV